MRTIVLAAAALLLVGCGSTETRLTKRLTTRERDSILATQKVIPGAATVGRALEVSDRSLDRAAQVDSLTR
jgi:hypothetical protein